MREPTVLTYILQVTLSPGSAEAIDEGKSTDVSKDMNLSRSDRNLKLFYLNLCEL
jgi:hypothetical protein